MDARSVATPAPAYCLVAALMLLIAAWPVAARDDPFAAFKLLGERTGCTVARLAVADVPADTAQYVDAEGERLNDAEARKAYTCARPYLAAAYRRAGLDFAGAYQGWTKFSHAYRSATHGNRYVNNYANPVAAAGYDSTAGRAALTPGAMLAKDSFFVDRYGRVYVGPLALMEKMYPGFNPAFQDWRYTLVLADGTVFRSANAVRSASVAFCGSCHLAAPDGDSLYFIPERYRVPVR